MALSPDILPVTAPAAEVTATLRSVPPSASTVSRVSTGTSRAPRSTLDITVTGGTSGSAGSVADGEEPWEPAAPGSSATFGDPVTSLQPTSVVATAHATAAASRRERRRDMLMRLPGQVVVAAQRNPGSGLDRFDATVTDGGRSGDPADPCRSV